MKIALIIIAYLILGLCSTLGFMIFEYKTAYSRYTPEEFYEYEVEGEEIIYVSICLFWPITIFLIGIIYWGIPCLVKLLVHIMAYILNGGSE